MTPTSMERSWTFDLPAEFGVCNVTSDVQSLVSGSAITTGMAVIQMVGSTGAITTIEYESGALADLRRALDAIAPATGHYDHNARWGDGNGYSHLRSAMLKTSIAAWMMDSLLMIFLDNIELGSFCFPRITSSSRHKQT